jgi:hypothetical protein
MAIQKNAVSIIIGIHFARPKALRAIGQALPDEPTVAPVGYAGLSDDTAFAETFRTLAHPFSPKINSRFSASSLAANRTSSWTPPFPLILMDRHVVPFLAFPTLSMVMSVTSWIEIFILLSPEAGF